MTTQYTSFSRQIYLFFTFLLLVTGSFATQAGTPISICTDSNFWYPFTFVKEKEPAGLHIDIIDKALKNIGYEPTYKTLPWRQCLSEAKAGHFDAVATVAYREDRAAFLNYPAKANEQERSPLRVTQVEYVVITPAPDKNGNNLFVYSGDLKNIPSPVRIPAGYSIIENLEREGLTVVEGKSSVDNFNQLMKEKKGSVIDLQEVAHQLAQEPKFKDQFVISSQPIFSRSYFLAFSKDGKIKEAEGNKIWQSIAKVRKNDKLMSEFLSKY